MSALQNKKEPEELCISELFSGVEYIVPIYQRNYAWGAREIEQLIEDIADTNNVYYLGTLIVNQKDTNVYEVIDGQQRLTTLFLLMLWLEKDATEEDVSKKTSKLNRSALRFEAREKSNKTLCDIHKDFKVPEDKEYSDEIVYGFRIIEKYFKKKDTEARTDKKPKSFTDHFRARLPHIRIIRTPVPDNIDLNHYFEIMNTRGEQLELHEIVKYKLLELLEKKDKQLASDIWNACSRMDRYIQMNFQPDMREVIFGANWEDFCVDSFAALRDSYGAERNLSEKKASLLDILERKVDFNDNNENTSEENERFESILSFPNFLLQVNAAMHNTTAENEVLLDDKKLLELLAPHWENKENAQAFLFALLKYRYYFDTYVIKREFAKDYKEDGRWSLKALKGYKGKGENQKTANYVLTYGEDQKEGICNTEIIKMLQACLRVTYTSPKTMYWISELLRELPYFPEKDAASHHIRLLEEYASKKVRESKYEEASGFGFERIVFTYLDYLLWRHHNRNGIFDSFQFQFRTSIEHFYPQQSIEVPWNEEPLNDFGNLALLTVSANSRFSNLPPEVKVKPSKNKDIVQQSPKLRLMAELIGADGWNEEKAREHGVEMKAILKNAIEKRD